MIHGEKIRGTADMNEAKFMGYGVRWTLIIIYQRYKPMFSLLQLFFTLSREGNMSL